MHPTRKLLAASSIAGVVHVWNLDVEAVTNRVCKIVGEPVADEEWRTRLPDTPYQPPCRED